jgi:hypothetical protein
MSKPPPAHDWFLWCLEPHLGQSGLV